MAYRELMEEWGRQGDEPSPSPFSEEEAAEGVSRNDPNYWLFKSLYERELRDPNFKQRTAGTGVFHWSGEMPYQPPYVW